MKIIALTGADHDAMSRVQERILETTAPARVSVIRGVNTAHEANLVYSSDGELWRIGLDSSRPELDALVDRHIQADEGHLIAQVDRCIAEFLRKQVIA